MTTSGQSSAHEHGSGRGRRRGDDHGSSRKRSESSGHDTESDLIMRAARSLRRRFAHALGPWDLSPHQSRALRVIANDSSDEPSALRLSALADALHIAARSATDVVDALEAKGLAERFPDAHDRRAICLRLTRNGQRVADEVEQMRAGQAEDFMAALTPRERKTLAELLHRLVD